MLKLRSVISLLCFGMAAALVLVSGARSDETVSAYHNSPERSGNFTVPGLTYDRARALHADPGFHAQLSGHIYAQPLYWRGNLIAVTEDDTVESIDAKTGKEIWRRPLGTPVARSALSCGDIDPLGITGTPVIDSASGTIYLGAAVSGGNGPRHEVFAISLANGGVLPGWPVDMAVALGAKGAAFVPKDQNQRGALTILGNRVYVPYGGHFGDCGDYRGWVAGISPANPKDVTAWSATARGGGIWAPGGIASDGRSLFVATGNTFGASSWSGGEAVIRLSPELSFSGRTQDYFAPADWHALDQSDLDLGGSNPLVFDIGGRHFVLALGKDARAYLLDRDNLGGIGGALAVSQVATGAIRTSPAAFPAAGAMFVALQGEGAQCPSRGDLIVLKIVADPKPAIGTGWCGAGNGRGSPIVTTTDGHSNPIIWTIGAEGDGRLRGFNGETGALLFNGGGAGEAMTGTRRFQTLIATTDRLYVAADGRIYAFAF
jgi:hypothetical protein